MTNERQRIERILIVGGGTAGWLAAAYLNRALGDSVSVTLVESSAVPTVGVGEATLPTLGFMMRFLGFEDRDWMPEVNGTYKAAIKFVDWIDDPVPGRPSYYWHPFSPRPGPMVHPYAQPYFPEIGAGIPLIHCALAKKLAGAPGSIAEMVSPIPALCERKKSPKGEPNGERPVISAYHLDAGLLVEFLRKVAVGRGVQHVVGHVQDVRLDERGFVHSVRTADGRDLAADFFVDCSGFKGLLINQALGEPFVSDAKHLLCDSAVALHCKNAPEQEGISPFTTATALTHGWVWDIPLFTRNGCGYVYSRSHIAPDDAEREARAFLGPRSEGAAANHIRMRVGSCRRFWVKNCVAIGLSAAFLEPLESTGIFIAEWGLGVLLPLLPDKSFVPALADKYNAAMRQMYEHLKDFVILHYYLNGRNDTAFWKDVRRDEVLTDGLRELFELNDAMFPALEQLRLAAFQPLSYACILDGARRLPSRPYPLLQHLDPGLAEEGVRRSFEETARLVEVLPDHHDHLKAMYAHARS